MGNIRTKDIKQAAISLFKTYPERFGENFKINKKELDELKILENKHTRNKIAGYMVRIARQKENKMQHITSS